MIYFENASRGSEGFNTHLMSWTFCISFSNFMDRDFFFDFEIPCSTPPAFAFADKYRDRFRILLESRRSLVSELTVIPNRRQSDVDRRGDNRANYQLLYSYFATTEEMKAKFANTMMWDYFGCGRIGLTREELRSYDLIEWTHSKLVHPSCFYFLPREEKMALLRSVEIAFLESIETLAARVISEQGRFNAVHLRLGDFVTMYADDEYNVDVDRFKKYIRANLSDHSIPVLIATDGLETKEIFGELLAGFKTVFIDELIFDSYFDDYKSLEFTDFNVLSILNELICAAACEFIGTYRSTFTSIIHRLRQERYRMKDFNFFPDGRVGKLLDNECKLVPDSNGFFDWNRYTVFSEDHEHLGWMREWDFDRSALDV